MRLLVRNKAVLPMLPLLLAVVVPDACPIYAQSNSHSAKRAKAQVAVEKGKTQSGNIIHPLQSHSASFMLRPRLFPPNLQGLVRGEQDF
jgi:hypothetical protein